MDDIDDDDDNVEDDDRYSGTEGDTWGRRGNNIISCLLDKCFKSFILFRSRSHKL